MALPIRRMRVLDFVVASVAITLCAWPFLPDSQASGSLAEHGITVDQSVNETAMISKPLNGTLTVSPSGSSSGRIDWDVYTTAGQGFKLVVSTTSTPALRDASAGVSVDDFSSTLGSWSVGPGERRFGFSATGNQALSSYSGGSKYRGFQGGRAIEIGRRRGGAAGVTRTSMLLKAEMRSALPSSAKPETHIIGTAMTNL